MFTLNAVLVVLLLAGLIVVMLDRLPFGETHSISARDFPNIAADPHSAPRDTVAHR